MTFCRRQGVFFLVMESVQAGKICGTMVIGDRSPFNMRALLSMTTVYRSGCGIPALPA